jgi:hypothetical protein
LGNLVAAIYLIIDNIIQVINGHKQNQDKNGDAGKGINIVESNLFPLYFANTNGKGGEKTISQGKRKYLYPDLGHDLLVQLAYHPDPPDRL